MYRNFSHNSSNQFYTTTALMTECLHQYSKEIEPLTCKTRKKSAWKYYFILMPKLWPFSCPKPICFNNIIGTCLYFTSASSAAGDRRWRGPYCNRRRRRHWRATWEAVDVRGARRRRPAASVHRPTDDSQQKRTTTSTLQEVANRKDADSIIRAVQRWHALLHG